MGRAGCNWRAGLWLVLVQGICLANAAISASSHLQQAELPASPYHGHRIVCISPKDSASGQPDYIGDLFQLDIDIWGRQAAASTSSTEHGQQGSGDGARSAGKVVARVTEDQYEMLLLMPELDVRVLDENIQESVDRESRRISSYEERVSSTHFGAFITSNFATASTSDKDDSAEEERPPSWFDEFHEYDQIKEWYANLVGEHASVMRMVPSIGKTHEGRDIFAIHVNMTPPRAGKKQVWIQGLIHAREWISGAVVQFISARLAEVARKIEKSHHRLAATSTVEDVEFIIIPIVNPDGYAHSWTGARLWRKNRATNVFGRGVDLNRNFAEQWGNASTGGGASLLPISDTYRGPSAASEPEVQAIMAYYKKNANIIGAIDWHCFSQLILYPFGWKGDRVANIKEYEQLAERMAAAFAARNGTVFKPQQAYDLYPTTGSATDWFVGEEASKVQRYKPFSLAIELPPKMINSSSGFILDPKHIRTIGSESWDAFVEFVAFAKDTSPLASHDAKEDHLPSSARWH